MSDHRSSVGLAFALLTLGASSAHAFVCTQVNDAEGNGPSLSWFSREVPFCMLAEGTADIVGDDELDVLRSAFTRWGILVHPNGDRDGTPPQEALEPFRTSDLEFHECPTLSHRAAVGYNYIDTELNENLLLFMDERWPHEGSGGTADTETLALTTSTFNALTGEILDSDIEFNSANVSFSITALPGPGQHDLLNTAVHEVGHFVGLGHTPVNTAVMYKSAAPGEITKRTLRPDDRNGVVFKYPTDEPNGYCEGSDCTCRPPRELTAKVSVSADGHSLGQPGGCNTAGAVPVEVLLATVWMLRRRRRAH